MDDKNKKNINIKKKDEDNNSKNFNKRKIKGVKSIFNGIVYIVATFNNTKITITDPNGNVLCWGSGGKAGFKGSRKSTAYAAQQVASDTIKKAQTIYDMKEIEVRIKGPGPGRESAVRGMVAAGIEISLIKDITAIPHNGCRAPKRRRV